ncbi:hypothetical protein ASC75_23870 [Aminobacter sp. DSM 101952]|uniref:hypothetical protein n=1 Tax=Aminobacter sp. DSM 101952 TaxID=2735891 RepID=UPI0006FC0832|nr:hypothetical protein [Aminobacter sp. DSM 101952]KQU72453.1 hypothetical protein ASC75_23870 [Aminobacter sp. DSM 101952]
MKHHSIEQLQGLADIQTLLPMTRTERLERWARLLEHQPDRCLGTLPGTEFAPRTERLAMRIPGSPLTVAFEDPAFRAAGLADDSYGEAKRFFDLSDGQLHDIVCYCHHGDAVRGATAARRVRAAIGLWQRIRGFFA